MMGVDLNPHETHPAAFSAKDWISSLGYGTLAHWQEAFASSALAGERVGEICGETLRRLLAGEPVSDRYLLGLAWVIGAGTPNVDSPYLPKESITPASRLLDVSQRLSILMTDTVEDRMSGDIALALSDIVEELEVYVLKLTQLSEREC